MLLAGRVLLILVYVQRSLGFPVIDIKANPNEYFYKLMGTIGDQQLNPRNNVQNLMLQQILTGNAKSLEDLELLTEIATHDARSNGKSVAYADSKNLPRWLGEDTKSKDNIFNLNFTLNPDTAGELPAYDTRNPLLVFNVHLEYLTNNFKRKKGNVLADSAPYMLSKEMEDVGDYADAKYDEGFKNLLKKIVIYDATGNDAVKPNSEDDTQYSTKDKLLEAIRKRQKQKRGFSLLTRWTPYSHLGQENWPRRPYFRAVLRHGDNTLTAEAQASSMARPYGTPLRWG